MAEEEVPSESLLTVTVVRDEHGYGMKVSGDKPVYVQSVKEHGAAYRAGIRGGDRILRVDGIPVHNQTHQRVVNLLRANPSPELTVLQYSQRHKTSITAPVPVDSEKQYQTAITKLNTLRMMLDNEQKHVHNLRGEVLKVPDKRKQADIEMAEQKCAKLQQEIDNMAASLPEPIVASHIQVATPTTPRLNIRKNLDKNNTASPPPNNSTGFLSGLPRSLSNLTGQSLRNLRQAREKKMQQENQPPILRQNSEEKRRHNNTVPLVPTTCLDNTPPPLPPRSTERPKRNPLSPNSTPVNPLAKPKACGSNKYHLMHQSTPSPYREERQFRRSSHSLDGEIDGPQPNSIALQMSYPLVNAPPPPLQNDNRNSVPVLHVRSQSSPEHLDHGLPRCSMESKEAWERGTPPPGTPPPPYAHNTQPCADPQRAIISMEEDDSPASDNSTYSGLFSNLRSVRESKARTAVLLNWLLGERRCACANLLLLITDGYRAASGVNSATLRRWAYEIQSTFLMPNAVLMFNGVDESIANDIEHVLTNEYDKEEILRNVFRKARQKAKEELTQQLTEFQVKRQVGLSSLYAPEDSVLEKCDVDKAQEITVVERLMSQRLSAAGREASARTPPSDAQQALLAALIAAAYCLHCRPATIAAAVGGARGTFLQRDKLYKQRLKQLAKHHPQPYIVRGHHLQLQALTSVAHCHYCDHVIWGLAPQAYVCADCNLRVHRACAKSVEEPCCMDGEHHNNRISRFMERIHNNPMNNQDSSEKKSRKSSGTSHFLNMERSYRKMEDEPPTAWETSPNMSQERRDESDESLYESADGHSDAISASDDALPRLGKTPTISKESLKVAVTDEEQDQTKVRKGHRKAMSLSNPLEMMKNLGDEWFDATKKEVDKNCDKFKSRESLCCSEDDLINGKVETRKLSKKSDKSNNDSRKSSTTDAPKTRKPSKASSVSALNFLRRKKVPTVKSDDVVEILTTHTDANEILNCTKYFLEAEKIYASLWDTKDSKVEDTESEEEIQRKPIDHRRRLSRQASRSKSKMRGKSQSVKVNTLRKSHSGTLKAKKKGVKTPIAARSRQTSIVDATPLMKKKHSESLKHNSWLFHTRGFPARGEPRREGSSEDTAAADIDTSDAKEPDKDNNWRTPPSSGARGVNRAESCRERDAPRRGKHRNASDPNRLTAHNNHDLEPGPTAAPSGSSSNSSLSSRSNEGAPIQEGFKDQQADWSEEDEPLSAQWSNSLPPRVLETLLLTQAQRKRQEVIHELIVSEGSHVRWLKVLNCDFLRPLESQPHLLPPEELRALFPNLPGVRDRHARLYADLRAARSDATDHVVKIGPVADALLNTLGDSGYASCLSHFCRGQRMALESLRERRRKNKELQQFLASREQLPRCGRLQLRDLLACVWQRLTKYQLLLESILKTVSEEDGESETDISRVKRALDIAKEVLHSVDTSIRTAENEHRLRTIQSKLEVRAGGEWEELRRLDLTQHALRTEGELSVRNDANKRIQVLALMLEDRLVLLHREGDKYILKPLQQPSQQGLLSPVIMWDKVLFRPNAAVRNTFFLMNINQCHMHELTANTPADYARWVKYIQESTLDNPRPAGTPAHARPHSDSNTNNSTNVSRNPSDASEKSSTEETETKVEHEYEEPAERASEREHSAGGEGVKETERAARAAGRIVVVEQEELPAPTLTATVTSAPTAHLAQAQLTNLEKLKRLDASIARLLSAKSALVGDILHVPRDNYRACAELAVADTLGLVDVRSELAGSEEVGGSEDEDYPDLHQFLLAAQLQAQQLTELVSSALTPPQSAIVAARSGLCAHCHTGPAPVPDVRSRPLPSAPPAASLDDSSFDTLVDLDDTDPVLTAEHAYSPAPCPPAEGDSYLSAHVLAVRLSPLLRGLHAALTGALHAPRPTRAEAAASRETAARHRYLLQNLLAEGLAHTNDNNVQGENSNGG